jgi:hypothetical protein
LAIKDIKIGEDWVQRQIYAEDGTVLEFKYYYKKRQADQRYLTSKLAQQYNGYRLINKDLRSTIIWLKKINDYLDQIPDKNCGNNVPLDRETADIVKGLWVAALTFYGKCFSSAEGRKIKLDRTFLDLIHCKQHDFYLKLRNQFAAHSGLDSYEGSRIVLLVAPNINGLTMLWDEVHQLDYISNDTRNDLLVLVEYVQQKVKNKLEELRNEIEIKEAKAMANKYWSKKLKK